MDYTTEEIYYLVGKEDKTTNVTFKYGSQSEKLYGDFITVVFIYSQKEREELDQKIKEPPFKNTGFIKAKYLGRELDTEKKEKLINLGIDSQDIQEILYFTNPPENTFHSKNIRTISTLKIPISIAPKGEDLNWQYGFRKKQVEKEIGLSPRERNLYLAGKYYFEKEKLTKLELKEIYFRPQEMYQNIEWEYLGMKYLREEITEEERKRMSEILQNKKSETKKTLDKYLQDAGSSLKKLSKENIDQAVDIYIKVLHFHDRRLNISGKIPIYIDVNSYLHIYLRHVSEMQINKQFEHKDNFQWKEENVFTVMEKVIQQINPEIQNHFEKNSTNRYSRYGDQSIYFEGDYYTFHIEQGGRISTFHKNTKKHDKKASH
jgi:hypothetical protein